MNGRSPWRRERITVSLICVGRTLLSAAFDLGVDLDPKDQLQNPKDQLQNQR
jgi:hypothetical protein